MSTPRLSIVIPVYNASETVRTIVTSILNEDFRDFELLLVNDGSTDDTLAILQEIEKTDSRITVITKKNGGPSSARNAGIEKVRGDCLMFFDADDDIVPGALGTLMDAIQKTGSDLLVSGWQIDLETVSGYKHIAPERTRIDDDSLKTYVVRSIGTDGTLYNLWNKVFRREIIHAHNLRFREDLRFGEDLIFGFHYLEHVRQLDIIPDITYRYRVGSSTSVFGTSSLSPDYRRINTEELLTFAGSDREQELDDLTQWVLWRWLLSYWILISASKLPHRAKLRLIAEGAQGEFILTKNGRYIRTKKLILERVVSILRHSPRLALMAAKTIHTAKWLVRQLKSTAKKR